MLYKLESLRGIAACLVVLFHSPFNYGDNAISFVSNSYLFVDFFFVLSGFVMALAYSPRINNSLNFQGYLILRLGRVYPLHIIMLFVWLIYILIKQFVFESGFGGSTQFDTNNIASFISNIFLLNSMGLHDYLSWNYPAWSISTEFFAYITFYWLTVTFDNKNSLTKPLLISVLCYGLIIYLGRKNLDITYNYGFFRCLGAFYLGVFVYRCFNLSSCPKFILANLGVFEAFCIFSSLILVSVANLHLFYFVPVVAMFSFTVYIFSQSGSGPIGKLLLTAPFRKVGLWSYSIYMIHALIVAGVSNLFEFILHWDIEARLGISSLVINLFILVIVIIISKYSYSIIETTFREKSRVVAKKYNK